MKSFVRLGFGFSVIAAGAAQAADLPAKGAQPVEYVRVCSTYGAGFFYVPGTDSCLRVGGRVRAEFRYVEPFQRGQDSTGLRARGRLNIDHRTMTTFGLLRTYIRFEIDQNSGVYSNGAVTTNPKVQEAFVQFGGLTAGRAVSFFTDPNLPAPNYADLRFDDPVNADVALLAYTYSFGGGFSATLSFENGIARRNNNDLDFPLFGVGAPGPVLAPIAFTYGGERIPDVVGNLRYEGSWGGAQLSGAIHQIRDVFTGQTSVGGVVVPVLNPITGLPYPAFADTDYGFALAAHGYANVPFLGTRDTVWASATYTDGATAYINAGQSSPTGAPAGGNGTIGAGTLNLVFTDAFVDPFSGDFKTNKAYGIAGGATHNWSPEWETNVFGSWMRFDAPGVASYAVPVSAATIANGTAGTVTGIVDFNEYRIGTNTIWKPVAGLQLGLEVMYARLDPRGRVAVPLTDSQGAPTGSFKPTSSDDFWEGRIRINRDF
jgi:hypothetical protein